MTIDDVPAAARHGEAAPGGRCATPLDYFHAAHLQHRRICAALTAAAEAPDAQTDVLRALSAELAADVLRLDGARHLLFDLLRNRAEPGDDIARVLGILAGDFEADRAMEAELGGALRPQAGPVNDRTAFADLVDRFVTRKRRTIALENAVVLPIARLRLTAEDLGRLEASLDQRQYPATSMSSHAPAQIPENQR